MSSRYVSDERNRPLSALGRTATVILADWLAHRRPAAPSLSASLQHVFLLFFVLKLASPAFADTSDPVGNDRTMSLPGEECTVSARRGWSKPEKWAWKKICEGQVADFNQRNDRRLDPKDGDGNYVATSAGASPGLTSLGRHASWHSCLVQCPKDADFEPGHWNNRTLSPRFLEVVLLHEPFRSAIPRRGVQIVGAYFPHGLELTDAVIRRPLSLNGSRFASTVFLTRLNTTRRIALEQSAFTHLKIDSASIGGDLSLKGSQFRGLLDMTAATIRGDLVMTGAPIFCGGVKSRRARIAGEVSMANAKIKGPFDLDSAIIEGDFLIEGKTEFYNDFILRGTEIGDQLSIVHVKFHRGVNMNVTSVGGSLLMREAVLRKEGTLRFLTVNGNLDIRGATLTDLDLTGARVRGSLRLGSIEVIPTVPTSSSWRKINWEAGSQMVLQNTIAGAIQDTDGSWPSHLELDGLTYERLDRIGGNKKDYSAERVWFEKWLARDRSYTPQPYRQLAHVLRTADHEGKASAILFASRERERGATTWREFDWWRLGALRAVIGYGYGLGLLLPLGWASVFVWIGTHILRRAGEKDKGFWYSLDMILPVIRLQESHYAHDLESWAKYYFPAHQIIGYILIFFVVAGLSGLTE